jgi:hypothetical protein
MSMHAHAQHASKARGAVVRLIVHPPHSLLQPLVCLCTHLAEDDRQTLSVKDVRKRVAAQLQRDPKRIKLVVKRAIDDYQLLYPQDPQEANAEAEAAGLYARKEPACSGLEGVSGSHRHPL